jgi:Heavy-metal resistance
MNRPLVILLGALVLGAAIFAGSYIVGQRACNMMRSTDDLNWLRNEFHLSDADMARVRQLHEGYMPQCAEMCAQLAAKKADVAAALTNGTNVTVEAQKKLTEFGELRVQCQMQMLQHFINVSHAMPPAEGRRYLSEMERITIGFHEDIEQTMSPSAHGNP